MARKGEIDTILARPYAQDPSRSSRPWMRRASQGLAGDLTQARGSADDALRGRDVHPMA